ncbi:hypothetical protein ACIBI9_29365 [Nonomuraea sp. NPDC050451]|uniref:hypothetical protein n=1 Tax=Nonomuraea sp. NPDC050451 TaxID=3364364 RepID=UPI0037A0B2AB
MYGAGAVATQEADEDVTRTADERRSGETALATAPASCGSPNSATATRSARSSPAFYHPLHSDDALTAYVETAPTWRMH